MNDSAVLLSRKQRYLTELQVTINSVNQKLIIFEQFQTSNPNHIATLRKLIISDVKFDTFTILNIWQGTSNGSCIDKIVILVDSRPKPFCCLGIYQPLFSKLLTSISHTTQWQNFACACNICWVLNSFFQAKGFSITSHNISMTYFSQLSGFLLNVQSALNLFLVGIFLLDLF